MGGEPARPAPRGSRWPAGRSGGGASTGAEGRRGDASRPRRPSGRRRQSFSARPGRSWRAPVAGRRRLSSIAWRRRSRPGRRPGAGRTALRAGRLTEELEPAGFEALAGMGRRRKARDELAGPQAREGATRASAPQAARRSAGARSDCPRRPSERPTGRRRRRRRRGPEQRRTAAVHTGPPRRWRTSTEPPIQFA